MARAPTRPRVWPIAGTALLVSGCPDFLPGSDRAFDATVVESGVAMPLDAGAAPLDARPVTPPMDVGVDRGPPPPDVTPPADRGAPDVGRPDVGGGPPACGGEGTGGQPCCEGERCNEGFRCRRPDEDSDRVCQRCGGSREVCCEDDQCEGRRECEDGVCR